ncbi:NAD(P)-dependent oxidoreductase [Piscinibacter sp. HJYY11]|uniref:NAD(P)-dependent oxidoreductase n=1 Tax=Piscinibacter sp. HJYY11 TaxID=2801333 RepID=UPI00192029B2|nr:NAD(P)-dependent oxidoreductase [Piscinibacter sp. HJYY11]MBL0728960.1 NAD(P)-dependent oxidoreductase [Piscinibacter sp. HJYY11]
MNTEHSPIPVAWPIPRVGIIGVGNMGGAMAARLLSQDYLVAVHDIDAQREAQAVALGAMACPTPAGLAASSDVVIVAVVDAAQTEAVLFGPHGAAHALPPGSAVMLCPTIAPADTERFVRELASRGIGWFDAPMSGGPERARDGSMSLMLACEHATLDRHRALVETLSSKVFHLGERPGDGARTKLVNNLLAGINLAGAAEALALASRMGLNLPRTLAVIEQSSGQSWIGSDRLRRALQGDYLPRAHASLLNKDTHLALGMAHAAGADTPIGEQAAAVFAQACERGLAGMDDAIVFELLRRRERG